MQVPLMSSSLQLGNNFVVLGSIFTIKGDAETHRITVEYGSANFVKEISVTVKPEAFKVALAYCRDKIAEERRCLGYWNSDWEVTTAPVLAPVPVVPTPAPTDNKQEAIIAAKPPAHIFPGNQVYTRDDNSNWIVGEIKQVDLDNQTGRIQYGKRPFFITNPFAKILPVRQNRDQPEPDWRNKKVMFLPKKYEYTLEEGTIVADVSPNVVIITPEAEAEIVPFSNVYVVL